MNRVRHMYIRHIYFPYLVVARGRAAGLVNRRYVPILPLLFSRRIDRRRLESIVYTNNSGEKVYFLDDTTKAWHAFMYADYCGPHLSESHWKDYASRLRKLHNWKCTDGAGAKHDWELVQNEWENAELWDESAVGPIRNRDYTKFLRAVNARLD